MLAWTVEKKEKQSCIQNGFGIIRNINKINRTPDSTNEMKIKFRA